MKFLYKLIDHFGVHSQDMSKVPKITSLQYLKQNVLNEVNFFPTDKHERSLQIDIVMFDMEGQSF